MIRRLSLALALVACLSLALAGSAAARVNYLHPEAVHVHKASGKRPSVARVAPMTVKVGQKLVVYGKNFRKGGAKNKVMFLRPGGALVTTRAQSGSKTRLVVVVPADVTTLLNIKNGAWSATRLQIRVLTARFSAPTKLAKSPVVAPVSTSRPGTPATTGPACRQATTADSDLDGLSNALEITKLRTNPCRADTDGDRVPDGYEYQSALDINNTTLTGRDSENSLPCACKTPWPNPLDPTDAGADHDGDGLTLSLEYALNIYAHGPRVGSLEYSDGKQRSRDVVAPTDAILDYVDYVRYPSLQRGYLSDDERDADHDGLNNWDECCGRMTQAWWTKRYDGSNGYPLETPYALVNSGHVDPVVWAEVDPTNPDTDGDGVVDGLDDQDHDGLNNRFEVSRPWDWFVTFASTKHPGTIDPAFKEANGGPIPDAATGQNPWARVNPYNPCKPVASKTCQLIIPWGYYPPSEDVRGLDPEQLSAPPAAPWLWDANDHPYARGE